MGDEGMGAQRLKPKSLDVPPREGLSGAELALRLYRGVLGFRD